MARAQAMAIASELPNLEDVRLFDIRKDKAQAWADEMALYGKASHCEWSIAPKRRFAVPM